MALEYVDDVSVHLGDEVLISEQCKSYLTGNPISNWSIVFWKTFANWLENVEAGLLCAATTKFQLYVVPYKKPGFAQQLSSISTDEEIDTALEDIRNKRKRLKKAPECESFLIKVLDGNIDHIRGIIRNFELVVEDSDPIQPIHDYLDATIRHDVREAAIKFGIGEANNTIDKAIRAGDPPLISAEQFRRRFRSFISANDSERFLHSLSEAPTDEVIESTLAGAPCFIRQLDLIDADIEHKTRAASDYLLATGDRTRWAEEGAVFEGSMKEYDSTLLRRHQNLQTEVDLSYDALNDKQRGLLLYTKCCGSNQIPLEGRVVPEHFMPGSFNNLADRREIGWHSNFDSLLDDEA